MCLDDELGNRQAEADPPSVRLGLPIGRKDERKLVVRDALPGVRDREDDLVGQTSSPDSDRASLARELDGVANQVREDLNNPIAVAEKRDCAGVGIVLSRRAGRVCDRWERLAG